jgi:hypothetical protein
MIIIASFDIIPSIMRYVISNRLQSQISLIP